MAVSGRDGLSAAHPRATLPPRERLSTAHPKGGLSPGGGLSSAQPRGGLRSAVLARAAAPGVRGAADSLEPRLEPRKRRVGPREALRGVVGGPRGMWRGEGGPRGMRSGAPTLSSGGGCEVCSGEREEERGEGRCEAPVASSGVTSTSTAAAAAMAAEGEEAAVMAVARAAREAEEAVGCTQADTVSYKGPGEGERGRLGATAQQRGGRGLGSEVGGCRRPCPGQVRARVLVRVRSRCGLLGRAPRAGEAGASLDEAMSFFAALRGALATTRISRSCAVGHRGTCALGRRWPAAMHACGRMQGPPVCAHVCMGCACCA